MGIELVSNTNNSIILIYRKHKFKDPQNKIGNLYSAVTSHVHKIIRNHLCSYGATTGCYQFKLLLSKYAIFKPTRKCSNPNLGKTTPLIISKVNSNFRKNDTNIKKGIYTSQG